MSNESTNPTNPTNPTSPIDDNTLTMDEMIQAGLVGDDRVFTVYNFWFNKLTVKEQREVQRLRTAAQWYAWGRNDARPSEAVSAIDFGIWYALQAARYKAGYTSSQHAIQDEWLTYKDRTLASRGAR
jgi:hypothetical protein